MTRTCPDCGTPMEYDTRTTTVLMGTCGGCGHQLMVLQNGGMPAGGPEGAMPSPTEGVASPPEGPPCPACGAALTFRSAGGPRMEATCTGCGAVTAYVPAGSAPREFPRREGPRPGRFDDSGPGFRSSNARPCRECGGPLRFTTAPDGTISGECTSCGNRFILPPRRDFEGGRGGGRRFDRGPPRGKYAGRSGPRSYGRPPARGFRRREERDEDEDDRPRRRPRRE
jgi:hypothetical protein